MCKLCNLPALFMNVSLISPGMIPGHMPMLASKQSGCMHLPARCCLKRFDVMNKASHEVTYICMTHRNTSFVASLRLIRLYTAINHTAISRHCRLQTAVKQASKDGHGSLDNDIQINLDLPSSQGILCDSIVFCKQIRPNSKSLLETRSHRSQHMRNCTGTKLHSKHSLSH